LALTHIVFGDTQTIPLKESIFLNTVTNNFLEGTNHNSYTPLNNLGGCKQD
jgi:hypothetical protein